MTRLRCLGLLVPLTVLAVLVEACVATAALPVWFVPYGFYHPGVVRPSTLTLQPPDSDGSPWTWQRVHWTIWNQTRASGTAHWAWIPSPSIVTVSLSRPRACSSQRIFTRLDSDAPRHPHAAISCDLVLGEAGGAGLDGIGERAPKRISFGGDPSTVYYDIHWSRWATKQAVATGRGHWTAPYVRSYPVQIRATDPGACNGSYVYRTLEVRFPTLSSGRGKQAICFR